MAKEVDQNQLEAEKKEEQTGIKSSEEVELLFPISIDGTPTRTVTIRRPKVIDHKRAALTASGGSAADYEIHVFHQLTGIPVEAFEEMDYADYNALQEVYRGFLSTRPGKKSAKLS